MIAALPGVADALLGGLASAIAPCTLPLVPAFVALAMGTGDLLVPAVVAYCAAVVAHLVILGVGSDDLFRLVRTPRGLPGIVGAVLVLAAAVALVSLSRRRSIAVGAGVIVGAAFGAAWTPCVGPTLGRLLTPTGSSAGRGALLVAYGIGLSIPFIVLALLVLAIGPLAVRVRSRRRALSRAGALMLGVLALVLAVGWYRSVASFLARFVVAGS